MGRDYIIPRIDLRPIYQKGFGVDELIILTLTLVRNLQGFEIYRFCFKAELWVGRLPWRHDLSLHPVKFCGLWCLKSMETSIDLSRLKECLLKDAPSTRHTSLQWRHPSLWNQRQHRLLNSLFRQQSKFSNSALLTLLGNPPVVRGIHWSPLDPHHKESEMQRMFSCNKVPSPGPPSSIYFSLAWYSYSCQWDDCISVFGGPRILTVCVIWKRLNNSLCLSSTSLLFFVLSALCDVMYTARLRMAKLDDHNLLRSRQNGSNFPDDILIAFLWIKIYELRLRFHWGLSNGSKLTIFQHRSR